ncbi:filamentous hemagglutinin N-terminal domain-containing protein [Xenorhabdus bovienii]|uniref:two-partner secretion domain-containing protein n=1 Tax=Xenorhabdus bovienii TaxID=40576 RepID=UPI00237D1B07|nr:filamentous hemagglutinin N-terminal domain-containing protein [Xenorhabdus bovienii]MDE1481085.1 filamentous hemagglutinin N-terminal domain-containing protein [Xenorhabdus bovienii]MDE9430919.1 filamentous hemagglutinin N-terminal domain-containing protein [Xenorhabdus bovienii]MDE9440372.1 filamentous hemagglutinin N-terminal domain-containing protein [Xenorhabdus bovienii]MDE9488563.1 filamentous hemagglutinin N-terminal domain-containing protein [Xenorhabdus bovienii]MDE9504943.1 filam
MRKFKKSKVFTKTLISSFISFASITAFANPIISDNSNTQVHNVNNIPVVNIANPNGAGVSYNSYKEFNIESQGAVLNNSLSGVNSQLTGYLDRNHNLSSTAKIIVNEVVGSNRTNLEGALEIVGNKANVVISNQNGIVANGARFINLNNVNLNTGKVSLKQNGDLHSVNVNKGQITIGEKGLNGDGINGVALVSRFLELNGQIKGNDIFIKAGGDETDYNKPTFAIDTKYLGSIYANKIFVQSTENGFGINLGNLVSTENLTVSSRGSANLSGTIKSGNSLMVMAPVINQASNTKIEAGNGFPMLINMSPPL